MALRAFELKEENLFSSSDENEQDLEVVIGQITNHPSSNTFVKLKLDGNDDQITIEHLANKMVKQNETRSI